MGNFWNICVLRWQEYFFEPCLVAHWRGTLFSSWSPFSVHSSVLLSVHFLGFQKFSKTIRPIDLILGIHDLLGGKQNAIAYYHASVSFHRMLDSDLSILSRPLSLQPLIILVSWWNLTSLKWPPAYCYAPVIFCWILASDWWILYHIYSALLYSTLLCSALLCSTPLYSTQN